MTTNNDEYMGLLKDSFEDGNRGGHLERRPCLYPGTGFASMQDSITMCRDACWIMNTVTYLPEPLCPASTSRFPPLPCTQFQSLNRARAKVYRRTRSFSSGLLLRSVYRETCRKYDIFMIHAYAGGIQQVQQVLAII